MNAWYRIAWAPGEGRRKIVVKRLHKRPRPGDVLVIDGQELIVRAVAGTRISAKGRGEPVIDLEAERRTR
ncbi:MAG TPA: hypothetical protein VEH79_02030 [Gaiellaceae bacterium]|nr:hypothetical protein [Gaiellaceae bacterium]